MDTANGHEIIEILPNPDGHTRSITDAILRLRDGRRLLISILGGCHKTIPKSYFLNTILGPAPEKVAANSQTESKATAPIVAQPEPESASEGLAIAGVR